METLGVGGGCVCEFFANIGDWFSNQCREMSELGNHLFVNRDGDLQSVRVTPGYFKQTVLLFKRACLQRIRKPNATYVLLALHLIAGAILPGLVPTDAIVYKGIPLSLQNSETEAYLKQNIKPIDAISQTLQSTLIFLLIVSCYSVGVYGTERTVFFRECATGQFVTSYWTAKTLETFLWLPLCIIAFIILGYSSPAWLIQPIGTYYMLVLACSIGFYGIGMITSLLIDSAALLCLVCGIFIIIGFSGTTSAYGDMNSFGKGITQIWFIFWTTQGITVAEYEQYTYTFDVKLLNSQTPEKAKSNVFGGGQVVVGAGVGKGFNMDHSVAFNTAMAFLTAFFWHLVVLWTLKTKDRKKHR